jgi:hypothetical protein
MAVKPKSIPPQLLQKDCMMISLRDIRISNVFGKTVFLKANEPTLVPGRLVDDASAAGCVPYNEDEYRSHREAKAKEAEAVVEREELLVSAVQRMVERNVVTDFTATGLPRLEALNTEAGIEATAQERDQAYALWRSRNLSSRTPKNSE